MKSIKISIIMLLLAVQSFGQLRNTISTTDKIYGLSKIWEEVKYNFANFDNVPTLNWDSVYVAFIPKVSQTQNDYEYYKTLKRFTALLKDGHTIINYPMVIDTCRNFDMFGDYFIFLKNIENKAIIAYVNKSKKDEIPIGSEVIEVNGRLTEEYLENEIIPFVTASTDYVIRDEAVRMLLEGFNNQKVDVKIKIPSGEIKSLSLIHQKTTEREYYPPYDYADFKFKWIDNKIAYVAINEFEEAKIDSMFVEKLPEMRKAKGLIIDVRKNGGGSSRYGAFIAQYLSSDSLIYASKTMARTNNGIYRAIGSSLMEKDTVNNSWITKAYLCYHDKFFEETGTDTWSNDIPLKDRLIIPTVVLTGHDTYSATEEFLLFLDKSKQIIRIGENSGGSNGQPYYVSLPGGGRIRICAQHCTYPDGRKYVGCGVKPDIEIKETVDDLIHNRDAALEEAVKYLNKLK